MGLVRYIILGVIAYFIYNFIKKAMGALPDASKKSVEGDEVIEICPETGEVCKKNSKCKKCKS